MLESGQGRDPQAGHGLIGHPKAGFGRFDFDTWAASGSLEVTADNGCGSSLPTALPVTVSGTVPGAPTVLGNVNVCEGETEAYTVIPVPGAVSYTWDVLGAVSWVDNGTSINVIWNGKGNQQVLVTADNGCGSSPQTGTG